MFTIYVHKYSFIHFIFIPRFSRQLIFRQVGKRKPFENQRPKSSLLFEGFIIGTESTSNDKYNTKSSLQRDKSIHLHKLYSTVLTNLNCRSNSYSRVLELEKSIYKPLLKMSTLNGVPLTILHYNDVYNIEPNCGKEPVGGAARFCTALKSFAHLNPLILFSGDIFSPSMCKLNNVCESSKIQISICVRPFSKHFHSGRANATSTEKNRNSLCCVR